MDATTGNLLRIVDRVNAATTALGYDGLNRLCGVTNTAKNVNWSCAYSPFGARSRVTHGSRTTVRVTIPGTNRLLDEYENGALVRHHVWLNGKRVAVVTPNGVRYLHHDHLWSVRFVTDENGNVTGRGEIKHVGRGRFVLRQG